MWRKDWQVQRNNLQLSNVFYGRGSVDNIGAYLYPGGIPSNFILSGGNDVDRYEPLRQIFDCVIGRLPVIVLHAGSADVEDIVCSFWSPEHVPPVVPLWIANQVSPLFEPLYGLSDAQVVTLLRKLAISLGYSVTPRFERVVRAHLKILQDLEIPTSLSGLYYLCQFLDMGEFYQNIMDLPCGEQVSRRIWVDLGADDEAAGGQFDLFRAVVNNLAHDAEQSGWVSDNSVSDANCLEAIRQNAVFLLSVNDMYTEHLLTYLAEELKAHGGKSFVLLIDGLKVKDESFYEFLCSPNTGAYVGITGENVVEQININDNGFQKLSERMNCMVFFKHSTGQTATMISDAIGKFNSVQVDHSMGTHRGFFDILPGDRHDDIRFSTVNRYRVMPEEVMALGPGQAIIFDTVNDQVIHYN